jgi:hypothetical protein
MEEKKGDWGMSYPTLIARIGASVLSLGLVLATVPPVGAAGSVFGTIQVSGPAWVASGTADWSRLSSTRPLVSGDRLKTGSDGYLLADLGDAGVVGLYGDAEVTTSDAGPGPVINVHKGKVAFHLSPESNMRLQAQGAGIATKQAAADGYVEYDGQGVPVVVVEEGSLLVQIAGVDKTLSRGDRLALEGSAVATPEDEPMQLAGATDDDDKKAAAMAAGGGATYGGMSTGAWTAVGVVVAATGGAIAASSGGSDSDPTGGHDE